MKFPLLAAAFSLLALPAAAHDFGFAGVLSNTNKGEMPGILLSVGQPLTDGPIALKSGMVYELRSRPTGRASWRWRARASSGRSGSTRSW